MPQTRRYEDACEFLQKNGLRFSRQRMVVINEMFFNDTQKKHFKLNELLQSIEKNHKNINISSASLINILKGLCNSGHIKEVYINKPYYDTNTTPHLHLYHEGEDKLMDIEGEGHVDYILNNIKLPSDYKVKNVNCVIGVDYSTEENI